MFKHTTKYCVKRTAQIDTTKLWLHNTMMLPQPPTVYSVHGPTENKADKQAKYGDYTHKFSSVIKYNTATIHHRFSTDIKYNDSQYSFFNMSC